MATSLEALGKGGQFIPGFQASLNGVAQGLHEVEAGAQESAKTLEELKKAEQDVQQEGNKRAADIQANAAREKEAWQGVIDQALQARDQQMKAQTDLINQRQQSAAYDAQEQALWAQRVENIKQVTAAIADQGRTSKVTKDILRELTKIDGTTGNKNKDLRIAMDRLEKLRKGLSGGSSEESKQEYLEALRMAEAAANATKKTGAYFGALRKLKEERAALISQGVISKDGENSIDADTTAAKKKFEILREEINGVTTFTQVDANTDSAKQKVGEMIQWVNSQKAQVTVDFVNNGGSKPSGYATGGLVGGYGNSDSVRALLTPGEFVFTKSAVQRLGIPYLNSLNAGSRKSSIDNLHIPHATRHYAAGGLVEQSINHVIELKLNGNTHKVVVNSGDAVKRLANDLSRISRTL